MKRKIGTVCVLRAWPVLSWKDFQHRPSSLCPGGTGCYVTACIAGQLQLLVSLLRNARQKPFRSARGRAGQPGTVWGKNDTEWSQYLAGSRWAVSI